MVRKTRSFNAQWEFKLFIRQDMKFTQELMIERLRHKRWLRKRIDTIKTLKDDPEIDFGRSLVKTRKVFYVENKRRT